MQTEAIFEAPASHEATHELHEDYSIPEATEWETHEAHESHYSNPESHFSNPEWEFESHYAPEATEWETHETHYSNPYSGEAELGNILSSLGGAIGSALGFESEDEFEDETEYEFEDEADLFFKKAFRAIKSVAKRVAPFAVRALGGMIPGVGAIAGPLLGQLAGRLLNEAEMEVEAMEAHLFGQNEAVAEVAHTEVGHEAALTELLAAEAAEASTEAEAEAVLAASLPITITIMGARRLMRPVVPTLTQANARLVRVLRSQGPAGRQLLRTVPAIQRRTIGTLRAAARDGQRINGPLAVRAMAAATRNVLANPRQVQRVVTRNAVIRQRVAPASPRRTAVFTPGRVAPPNPRRAAGFQPMRAARARRP